MGDLGNGRDIIVSWGKNIQCVVGKGRPDGMGVRGNAIKGISYGNIMIFMSETWIKKDNYQIWEWLP